MKRKILLAVLAISSISLSGCDFRFTFSNSVTSTAAETTSTVSTASATSSTSTTTTSTATSTVNSTSEAISEARSSVSVTSSSSSSNASASSSQAASSSQTSQGQGYHLSGDLSQYTLQNHSNLTALGQGSFPSSGTRKILVVPVRFSNNSAFTTSELSVINKAYNGASNEVGWESLQSFYKKSSFNALTIEATVTSEYVYSGTDLSFQNAVNKKSTSVDALANAIITSLASKYNLSDYDANDDGYLDGFEMVYKSSYEWDGTEGSTTEVWWNYTSFDSQGAGTVSSPKCGLYFFSEFTMISNGYYTPNIDCHTLIHESGHMLGLNDYYSYDDSPKESPAGIADMMDNNIGDHNAYSKMLLGWVKPMVIDGTSDNFSITLNSFADTGDCILLRNTSSDPWNGTPYDEYLILQYFTPTNLNYSDSVNGYEEFNGYGVGGLYKKAGLQVFHVDSRVMDLAQIKYSDKINGKSYIAASNTGSGSADVAKTASSGDWVYNSPYRLIKAIPATGKDIFTGSNSYNYLGYQKALFGTSAYGCGSTTYTNSSMSALFTNGTKFNDGSTLDYSFTVTAQTNSTITLAFSKI